MRPYATSTAEKFKSITAEKLEKLESIMVSINRYYRRFAE
jgi:hypothetical protein